MTASEDDDPGDAAQQDHRGRHETSVERLDRQYEELLQELRVAQTGVQILFGFLLSLAFYQRFDAIHGAVLVVYVGAVVSAALAACALIAPVPAHRILFRHGAMEELVEVAHRSTLVGLCLLGLAVSGALLVVLEVVLGWAWALLLGGLVTATFAYVWYVLPTMLRRQRR